MLSDYAGCHGPASAGCEKIISSDCILILWQCDSFVTRRYYSTRSSLFSTLDTQLYLRSDGSGISLKSGGTVDQLVTAAVTVTSLLCQRTFQADSNPRPHSCLRPACKITVIVLLHCGRGRGGGGAGADTSRRTQARSGPMCSLHRGYYSHCHTAPYYATPPPPAPAAELLAPAPLSTLH